MVHIKNNSIVSLYKCGDIEKIKENLDCFYCEDINKAIRWSAITGSIDLFELLLDKSDQKDDISHILHLCAKHKQEDMFIDLISKRKYFWNYEYSHYKALKSASKSQSLKIIDKIMQEYPPSDYIVWNMLNICGANNKKSSLFLLWDSHVEKIKEEHLFQFSINNLFKIILENGHIDTAQEMADKFDLQKNVKQLFKNKNTILQITLNLSSRRPEKIIEFFNYYNANGYCTSSFKGLDFISIINRLTSNKQTLVLSEVLDYLKVKREEIYPIIDKDRWRKNIIDNAFVLTDRKQLKEDIDLHVNIEQKRNLKMRKI